MRKEFTIVFFAFLIVTLPQIGNSAGLVPCGDTASNPCTFCHFFQLFANIVNFVLFRFVPPLAILMFVWGGAMFLMAAGDPGRLNQAKGIFTSTLLGLAIVYAAWLVVNLFFASISASVGFSGDFTSLPENWFRINCPIR
jgi:hypothetical protein